MPCLSLAINGVHQLCMNISTNSVKSTSQPHKPRLERWPYSPWSPCSSHTGEKDPATKKVCCDQGEIPCSVWGWRDCKKWILFPLNPPSSTNFTDLLIKSEVVWVFLQITNIKALFPFYLPSSAKVATRVKIFPFLMDLHVSNTKIMYWSSLYIFTTGPCVRLFIYYYIHIHIYYHAYNGYSIDPIRKANRTLVSTKTVWNTTSTGPKTLRCREFSWLGPQTLRAVVIIYDSYDSSGHHRSADGPPLVNSTLTMDQSSH